MSVYVFSLIDDYENVSECETWKCEKCEMVAAISPFERLQHIKLHEKQCQLVNTGAYIICICTVCLMNCMSVGKSATLCNLSLFKTYLITQ